MNIEGYEEAQRARRGLDEAMTGLDRLANNRHHGLGGEDLDRVEELRELVGRARDLAGKLADRPRPAE